ncbi:MAG: DUF748 domain-containing protein, partial [Bacteroidales bacterium]|nr:DUF748 domain-containing protein [Bacteroidales bacterium]
MKKKYWYIILSIFLLIVVIVMVIAPGIAKNYAIKNSHELLGRQIDLHKFKVNYFTGTVRLVDFKMYEPDGKTVFVAFDTLLINTVPYRLLTNDLVIQQLYLKGLNTSVVQKDSVFNFDDLIAFYASESDTIEADTVESSSLNFEMSDFKLSEAKIKYNDLEVGKVHDLNDINLSIPYISWDQDASSEAGLRFNFRNEGYFQSSIKVDPNKGDFDAKLEISLLQLENFSDYLKKYIDVGSFSGLFNSKIQLAGNINQPENIIVSGLLNIADLKSTDLSDKQFLTIENLDCFVNKIDAGKMEFVFDSVILDKAYVCFDVNDSSNNIFDIVHYYEYFGEENEAVSSADKPENDTSASISYVVNNVRIKDGFVDFIDNMTSKTFEYRLSEISAFVDEINSSSSNIDEAGNIGLSLVLNDEARVSSSLKAEINFGDFDADVKVSNLKLGTFEDYARDYINIGSMDGVLGAEMKIRGNMYEPEKAIVSGWAGVEEFYLTDNNMWTIASVENMGFQINNVDAASMAFHFDSIFINRPYLYFEMMDSTNNIFDVFG